MRSHLRQNVIAYLALFVALGGTSYAVTALAPNSVGSAQIQRSAVRSAEVKNRSLLAKDFKPGQLPGGTTGPPGETGLTGLTGPAGVAYAAQAGTGENPANTYTNGLTSVVLQLPSAGRVYAYGRVRVNAVCAGGAVMTAGLYIDGVAILGSGQLIGSGTTAEFSVSGLSASVLGGVRNLQMGVRCAGGVSIAGTTAGPATLGGLLVGA
jgi:hypothetical protein